MVRLKVTPSPISPHQSRVSIPYGTIKSMLSIDIDEPDDRFQFLMVRLKEFRG